MSNPPKIQSSHAILLLSDRYVLQLRDDIPTIADPGKWTLFGGLLNEGEDPLIGVRREVFEELSIKPLEYKPLWFEDCYAPFEKEVVRAWFFEADISEVWGAHQLKEGREVKAFKFEELSTIIMPSVMKIALRRHHNELIEKGKDIT